ncbi:MAG: flippase-like domain-containing protein [Patescibacteria group bacterium]
MNKIFRLILFISGISILSALIYRVGFHEIIRTIAEAKVNFLIYGLSVYLVLILARAFKWFLLVRVTGNKIGFKKFLPLYFVSSLMGNITPFKSGEAIAPFLFEKYLKIPVGQGFAIVILDRFFELITFAIILILTILYIIPVFQWAPIPLFALISLLIILIVSQKTSLKILGIFNVFKKYSLFKRILEFAEKELQFFYDGLFLFKNKKVYRFIIPLTIICWLLEFLSFYFIVSSVLSASFFHIAAAQVMAIAAILLTFIPVGIGIGEVGIVYVLNLFNYPTVLSAGGALLARLILTGALFTVGIIGTFLLKEKNE